MLLLANKPLNSSTDIACNICIPIHTKTIHVTKYISRSIYDFHTGRIRALGTDSKIVYFLASLFAASLPVTGFLISWGRRKKGKKPLAERVRVGAAEVKRVSFVD